MNTFIAFDGVTLESIAPVKVEDIRVSPIQYTAIARERAIRGGSEFVRMKDGTRTVSITFAILEDNLAARQDYLAAVCKWAKTDAEHKLTVHIRPTRYLTCVCTQRPEPSSRQWWESKLRIVFTCYDDPYWNSIHEKTVPCGTSFMALGDAPPHIRIEATRNVLATNQTYSNGSESMTFTNIPAGDMVIDLDRQTAESGGINLMQYYTFTSRFLVPKIGDNNITGVGTVKYRERWE